MEEGEGEGERMRLGRGWKRRWRRERGEGLPTAWEFSPIGHKSIPWHILVLRILTCILLILYNIL